MTIRSDRVYALISNAIGLVTPNVVRANIFSRLLSRGHQRPIRKHADTPFWFRESATGQLHLLKNMYRLGNMFIAYRFVCSEACVDRLLKVCPNLRYVPAVIERAFYVEYEPDGTIHVPKEDLIRPALTYDDEEESDDDWLDRLAEKYRVAVPGGKWFEIVEADGEQTCKDFPVVREIDASDFGGSNTLRLRPQAVEHFGWVALGQSCVSSRVLQVIDEYLPRPYVYVMPFTLDGYPCVDEAW
jgi:hypothetical protein